MKKVKRYKDGYTITKKNTEESVLATFHIPYYAAEPGPRFTRPVQCDTPPHLPSAETVKGECNVDSPHVWYHQSQPTNSKSFNHKHQALINRYIDSALYRSPPSS